MNIVDIYTLRRCNFLTERRFRLVILTMEIYSKKGKVKNEYYINTTGFST